METVAYRPWNARGCSIRPVGSHGFNPEAVVVAERDGRAVWYCRPIWIQDLTWRYRPCTLVCVTTRGPDADGVHRDVTRVDELAIGDRLSARLLAAHWSAIRAWTDHGVQPARRLY